MQTRDLGRAFFHMIHVRPDTPLYHFAPTVEIEPPYRRSDSLIIRLPFSRALVIGWWKDTTWGEEDALLEAVSGWGVDPYDESDLEDPEVKRLIRANVAARTHDLDSEWEIISALGVES